MEDDSMKNCHIKVLCKYMYKNTHLYITPLLPTEFYQILFDGLRGTVLIKHGNN